MTRILFIAISILISFTAKAQPYGVKLFGATSPQDTSKTGGQMVWTAYATNDTLAVFSIGPDGRVKLRATTEFGKTYKAGYGIVIYGTDTIRLDSSLLQGVFVKQSDSVTKWVTATQLAAAIASIPETDITGLRDTVQGLYDSLIAHLLLIDSKIPYADSINKIQTVYRTDTAKTNLRGEFHKKGGQNAVWLAMFGDSFTFGANASPITSGYAFVFARYFGLRYRNLALSGSGINYACRTINSLLSPGHNAAMLMMAGLNDFQTGDTSKTKRKIVNGYMASLANFWSATQAPAGGGGVTRVGTFTTHDVTPYGGKYATGTLTATLNDTIKYSFTDSTVFVVLIGSNGTDVTYSDVMIMVDGVNYGTISTNNQTNGNTLSGYVDARQPMAFFVTGLSYGAHTFYAINKSSDTMMVDYVGSLKPTSQCNQAIIGLIPQQNSVTSNVQIRTNNLLDSTVRAVFPGRPFVIVNSGKYWDASGLDGDGTHPNTKGHVSQIFPAFAEAVPVADLPKAYLDLNTNLHTDLIRASHDSVRVLLVDSFGDIYANRVSITNKAIGTNYFNHGGEWADTFETSGHSSKIQIDDTIGFLHSTISGDAYSQIAWARSLYSVTGGSQPYIVVPGTYFRFCVAGNGYMELGQNAIQLALKRSGGVQHIIGTSFAEPPVNGTYIGEEGAEVNSGGQYKHWFFYHTGGYGYFSVNNHTNAPTNFIDIDGDQAWRFFRMRKRYTPSSSSDTNGAIGSMWFDDNYLYYKISDGTIKRIPLEVF